MLLKAFSNTLSKNWHLTWTGIAENHEICSLSNDFKSDYLERKHEKNLIYGYFSKLKESAAMENLFNDV